MHNFTTELIVKIRVVAGTIDTLPLGQCVSLSFKLISIVHQLQTDYFMYTTVLGEETSCSVIPIKTV